MGRKYINLVYRFGLLEIKNAIRTIGWRSLFLCPDLFPFIF